MSVRGGAFASDAPGTRDLLMSPKPKLENHQSPKDAWRSAGDQIATTHKKNCLIRGLTPELSRTAARLGVMVHVTI